ncbi:MAG: polysaccharide deacetylase family sporulation protein PdaB [Selenomonadales bacterium]|nr:polysaccharide deacetylase family sporulation protein PdaB [Selenomonadales bacterium]MBQ5832416.1 polysaccharide deacetylase family sporulation protein PdaB [Selenomonadales bacterium]
MVIDVRKLLGKWRMLYGVVGLLLASALYVQAAGTASGSPMAIAGTQTTDKVVALTFDHSWGNTFTPSILETLKDKNVKATFFLMGPWTMKYPEVAKQICADGHEIGSHGHKHDNYGEKSSEWVKNDIMTASREIEETIGVRPTLLRPPNGSYSKESLRVTEEAGCRTIIWNIDSLDWKNPGREVIIDRVMKRLKAGGIILMHASDTPRQTADALPELIDRIRAEGYEIVTVGDLLANHAQNGLIRH